MRSLGISSAFLLASFLFAGSFAALGQVEHFARDRQYDVLHYKLDISVDEKSESLSGEATIRLLPLLRSIERVQIDAAGFSVSSVRAGGSLLSFEQIDDSLIVRLNHPYGWSDTLTLSISYSVSSPKKGLYFVKSDSSNPLRHDQVWSQGAAEDNHHWFPCYDSPNDRATSEMIVTVNEKFTAVSNGKLLGIKNDPASKTTTYHWLESRPHPSYLISLAVSDYALVKDSSGSLEITNYVYPEQVKDAHRSFGKVPGMISFFEKRTGCRYPWEKFGHVVVDEFMFGGMENTSIVTLTDRTIHDSRAHLDFPSDGLVAHELAHQWYGDMITCKEWSHAWLNEGFATYFENLYRAESVGEDDAAKSMAQSQNTVANLDSRDRRRPMVFNRYKYPLELFDSRIYGKGAVVLGMLRDYLGDDLFFKALGHYTEKYSFSSVETDDFKTAIEEATGQNLHWFFGQWVYGAGCPEFDLSRSWDPETRKLTLEVRQVQTVDSLTGLFRLPVEIEVWVHGSPEIYRVMLGKKEEKFSFDAYQLPQLVIFDRGSKILKKVNFKKTAGEWIFQLKNAGKGVDRLLAAGELAWQAGSEEVAVALSQSLLDDKFWGVREESAWALGGSAGKFAAESLLVAYGDIDSRVRRASVSSLGRFSGEMVLKTLRHAFENDSSYLVAAEALRSLVRADSVNAMKYLARALETGSHAELMRRTALNLLGERNDDESYGIILARLKSGNDPRVRSEAVAALARRGKDRDGLLGIFLDMLDEGDNQVRGSVIDALSKLGDMEAVEPLINRISAEGNERLKERIEEAIKIIKDKNK